MHQVLIVEDDQAIAESLSAFLKNKGYGVQWAENGREGLDKVHHQSYDVIIADIMMPEMNGISFLEKSKSDFPELDIIMVTGYADIKVAIEAMKKGAADFITKPFGFDHVEGTIRKLIERRLFSSGNELSVNNNDINYENIRALNNKLEKKLHELSILHSISEAMDSADEVEKLFHNLVELSSTITSSGSSAIYLDDGSKSNSFFLKTHYDSSRIIPRSKEVVLPGELIKSFVDNRAPQGFFDPDGIEFYQPYNVPRGVKSLLIAPLYVKSEHFGILTVEDKSTEMQFDATDMNYIGLLLKKASVALENNALYETIFNNLINTLKSLVTTLEAKDKYTQRHSDRVTRISTNIAGIMGCSEEDIEIIGFAGMLHDIGKIGVSDAVLQKRGKLTSEEYEIIKEHPGIGDQILEPLGMLPREQAIIRHHHERWDGNGYPDGLKGKEIPFLARIVSLADAYDAMTSNRVYRGALSHEVAVEEIKRNAGFQFDSIIVKAFISLCGKNGSDILYSN